MLIQSKRKIMAFKNIIKNVEGNIVPYENLDNYQKEYMIILNI